jgi:hypothetical protein
MSPIRLSLALATILTLAGCVVDPGPYQTSSYGYGGYGYRGYEREYVARPTVAIEGGWGREHRPSHWDRDQDRDWGRW